MAINDLWHLSALGLNRRLGVRSRKRAMQYLISGIRTEKQVCQQYGLNRILLWELRRWYWRHFEAPHFSSPVKHTVMRTKEKALQERIRKLEKEKRELEKALEWERIRSQTFETMIDITEKELGLPIRKKPGARQSGK